MGHPQTTTSAEDDPGIAVFRGQPMLLLHGTWVRNRRIIAEPTYLSLGAVSSERGRYDNVTMGRMDYTHRFPVEKW